MKPSANIILTLGYYDFKKEYINENFNVEHLFSLDDEQVGQAIDGQIILSISKISEFKSDVVIIAMEFSPIIGSINKLLFKLGYTKEQIVLLFDLPKLVGDETALSTLDNFSYQVSESGEIICKIGDIKVLIFNYEGLFIINEIFGLNCYDISVPDGHYTVVDIGMNVGTASLFFASKDYVDKIYAFEPFPTTYERALENFGLNDLPFKITPHLYGLGSENKIVNIPYNGNFKGQMSTTRDNSAFLGETIEYTEKAEIRDVSEVFLNIISQEPNQKFLFKIDCEGGEYEIIQRLAHTGLLSKIRIIIMEWHVIEGQNLSDLESTLQQNGFIHYCIGSRKQEVGTLLAVNKLNF